MSISDILPPGALTSFLVSSGTTATSGASQAIDASGPSGSVGFVSLPMLISPNPELAPSPGNVPVSLEMMLNEIHKAISGSTDISGNLADYTSKATGPRKWDTTAAKLTQLTKGVDTKLNALTTSLEGLATAVENAKKPYGPQAGGRRRSRKRASSKRVRRTSK